MSSRDSSEVWSPEIIPNHYFAAPAVALIPVAVALAPLISFSFIFCQFHSVIWGSSIASSSKMPTIGVWSECESSSDDSPQVVLVFASTGAAKMRSMVDVLPIRATLLSPPQEAVPCRMLLGLISVLPALHQYLPCRPPTSLDGGDEVP